MSGLVRVIGYGWRLAAVAYLVFVLFWLLPSGRSDIDLLIVALFGNATLFGWFAGRESKP